MPVANAIVLAISLGLEFWLLTLLFHRDVRHHFPVFFGYIVVSAPVTLARLLTIADYPTYFLLFWGSTAVLVPLSLAALHEVFRWVYEGFYELWWFRLIYFGTMIVVIILTARNAMVNPPVQAHPIIGLILSIGIAVNLLRAGIAALFGALIKPLVIEVRRYPFGIAAGFAASSIGPLVGYLARSIFGKHFESFAGYTSAMAYILGLVVWIVTFARTEPEEKAWAPPMTPEEMLRVVQGYLGVLGAGKKDKERR
jgi:hypothetical protein